MTTFSQDSHDLRTALAYACRILAANGQNDTVYGHASYRNPGGNTFWMKPSGIGMDEVFPDTLVRLDLDGNVVEGDLPRHLEYPIHAEIFRARPEVTCVVHTHPIHSIAFAALDQPLRPVLHEGAQFSPPDVPRFTQTSSLILTPELGVQLAASLGQSSAVMLRNHGIATAATTIEEAVVAAINLERACQVQLLAAASGVFSYSSDADALHKRALNLNPKSLRNVWNYYCRQVDRTPGFSFTDQKL